MKRLISVLLSAVLMFMLVPSASAISSLDKMSQYIKDLTDEEPCEVANIVHDRLMEEFDNEMIVAAFLGNMEKESQMIPGMYEGDWSDDAKYSYEYADKIGIYDSLAYPTLETRYIFSHNGFKAGHYGYGLCQWTDTGRKQMLYDMAVEENLRLDDPNLQCDFIIWEMTTVYTDLYDDLKDCDSLETITMRVASTYERCNAYMASIAYRFGFAKYYYEYYTGEEYIGSD